MKIYCITLAFFLSFSISFSQSVPLSFLSYQEYIRRKSLIDSSDRATSFMNRPFDIGSKDSSMYISSLFYDVKHTQSLDIKIFPFFFEYKYNSFRSSEYNEGSLFGGRGSQFIVSGGIFLKYNFLSFQFMPEFIYSDNKDFLTFPFDHPAHQLQIFIDAPQKYGEGYFTRFLFGQSSFKFHIKKMSIGISTQNLWWGPAKRNALVMSNNAEGFLHFFFQTETAIPSILGNFEWQIIAGTLKNSSVEPQEIIPIPRNNIYFYRIFEHPTNIYNVTPYNVISQKKKNDGRYISGINFIWNPKWTAGLFLGLSISQVSYHKNLQHIQDYLPIFNGIRKEWNEQESKNTPSINIHTFSLRWVVPREMGEVYIEYGSYGKLRDVSYFFKNPNLDRGFTVGVTKLFSLKKNHFLQLFFEMTELQQNSIKQTYSLNSWYTSNTVRHGYTNNGKVLGAGIGPGSNTKYLEISWVKGINKISFGFEYLNYNNDLRYFIFRYPISPGADLWKYWVETHYNLSIDWYFRYTKTFVNFSFKYMYIYDYNWNNQYQPIREYWQTVRSSQKGLDLTEDAYNYFFQIKIIQPFYK
ncbi:MAG: capsule assembly Wzi family protein, partial [Chitinophagaceae bacterium]|nr:capsule assembly Wzi family protein [Chitinophagaceae bacterium]